MLCVTKQYRHLSNHNKSRHHDILDIRLGVDIIHSLFFFGLSSAKSNAIQRITKLQGKNATNNTIIQKRNHSSDIIFINLVGGLTRRYSIYLFLTSCIAGVHLHSSDAARKLAPAPGLEPGLALFTSSA